MNLNVRPKPSSLIHLLKRRGTLIFLGGVLVSLLIYFVGPGIAFFGARPLGSLWLRISLIVLLWLMLIVWLSWSQIALQWATWRQGRQQKSSGSSVAVRLQARQLKKQFRQLRQILTKGHKSREQRYELPWYLVISSPQSGKELLLKSSEQHFAYQGNLTLDQADTGISWWLSDQALWIVVSGKILQQQDHHLLWKTLIRECKRFRARRPLNGVMMALSLKHLLNNTHAQLEPELNAHKERLEELRDWTHVEYPTYVTLTHADYLAGFSEYCRHFDSQERRQVMGMTFDVNNDQAPLLQFKRCYEDLVGRIHNGVIHGLTPITPRVKMR